MRKPAVIVFGFVAVLVFAFVAGSGLYQQQRSKELGFIAQKSFSTFVRDYSATSGPADAKVYLVEFFDPACETCAAMAPSVKQILSKHPGKVKLVMRCLPLHQGSDQACAMLEAAKRQGKYWEALEVMFCRQDAWASHHNPQPDLLWDFLAAAGIDANALQGDIADPEIAERVRQDRADARTLGVNKTPGFFVNGKPLVRFGRQELEALVAEEVYASDPS